jgi:hypothetical protein
MRHWLSLLLLAVLSACAETPPSAPAAVNPIKAEVVQPGAVCRVGPDGGPIGGPAPVVAERGIGGTGGPNQLQMTAGQMVARSEPASAAASEQVADRGIGGTGIVGVVTGFASICVDGLEVQYDSTVPVDIDGHAATPTQLRAGQVVAIQAAGPANAPQAKAISVLTEVAGPIEAIELGSGAVMVAGQRVIVSPSVWGATRFGLGDWAMVSGLRQADGTIVASRLDSDKPGGLMVRGSVSVDGGTPHIGALVLDGPATSSLHTGDSVVVSGSYSHGVAHIEAVAPDGLSSNPTSYFGGSVDRVVVQAFVRVNHGTIWLSDHLKVSATAGVQAQSAASGDAIVSLERAPDGSFAATSLRYTGYRATGGEASAPQTGKPVSATPVMPVPRLIMVPPAPPGLVAQAPPAAPPPPASPAISTPAVAPVAPSSPPISTISVPSVVAAPVTVAPVTAAPAGAATTTTTPVSTTAGSSTVAPASPSGGTAGTPGGASTQGTGSTLIISSSGTGGSGSVVTFTSGAPQSRGLAPIIAQVTSAGSSGTGGAASVGTTGKSGTISKPVSGRIGR